MSDEAESAPRIVVGVDGSESSKAALRWAARHAGLIGGVVETIIAWEYPYYWFGWSGPVEEPVDWEDSARKTLTEAIGETIGPDRRVEIHARVLQGNPAGVLTNAAQGAELLVVGHRGYGGFTQVLLGSVAHQCAQRASCPVLVIRGPGGAR
ncbi:universal stress protein [Streptomyces sp. NPDC048419]|uniref:universal stress protein n=1 Tax=Streptomyces sp. NPDC048419 TaxID=3365547 RepID=UPI003719FF9F